MKQKITNFKMEIMLEQLKPLLSLRNKVGYAAARNTRTLRNALTEYLLFKRELIEKYGEPDIDINGKSKGTISIDKNSPNFAAFSEEFEQIRSIEHEIDLMTLKYDEVIGVLSGEEILALDDWMLVD